MDFAKASGVFDQRRNSQLLDWVFSMVEEELKNRFYGLPKVSSLLPEIKENVLNGSLTPGSAVRALLDAADTAK